MWAKRWKRAATDYRGMWLLRRDIHNAERSRIAVALGMCDDDRSRDWGYVVTQQVESLRAALDAAEARAKKAGEIADYALGEWRKWVESELSGTSFYSESCAEIASLEAALGREGGEG